MHCVPGIHSLKHWVSSAFTVRTQWEERTLVKSLLNGKKVNKYTHFWNISKTKIHSLEQKRVEINLMKSINNAKLTRKVLKNIEV